jgi:malonyl-CoA/methylmalonyl-CoA synthetase
LQQAILHGDRPFVHERVSVTEEHDNDDGKEQQQQQQQRLLTYNDVLQKTMRIQNDVILSSHTSHYLRTPSSFIVHLTLPGSNYVACQWAAFASGMVSVPIATTHTVTEIQHILGDTNPNIILVSRYAPNAQHLLEAAATLDLLDDRVVIIEDIIDDDNEQQQQPSPKFDTDTLLQHSPGCLDTPALLMYTSGTTGRPKGVLHTHRNLYHQITDLVTSWEWLSSDVALHVLPLHHVHGVVNILSCGAYVGAQIQFEPFNAINLWNLWASSKAVKPTVFMAVPTIYAKLLEATQHLPKDVVERAVEDTLKPMRLQVSGSAALPTSVHEKWKALTGQTLLERYGMTEFCMALSNPYKHTRHPGHVGKPLPSVQVRLVEDSVDDDNNTAVKEIMRMDNTTNTSYDKTVSGNLQVKGPTVFSGRYWNRPDATIDAFAKDGGWFDTGDVAEYDSEIQSFKILGRKSVDILKVGGYKLSALDIERVLLEHPSIVEVYVLGVDDDIYGQRVAALARLQTTTSDGDETPLSLSELQEWCSSRISKHKIPTRLLVVDEVPKNAMGKVNKKELVGLFSLST